MAGGLDSLHKSLQVKEKLKPATTSLQNCLKFSLDCKYLGLLCDFGVAVIIKLRESNISTSPEGCIHKTLEHGSGVTLEGQSWSPDGEIYAVLGCKAYLYQVSSDFSLFNIIPLYYIPKDITISTTILMGESQAQLKYKTAIAGPNGVEIYDLEIQNSSVNVKEGLHLHADLAIVLVDFSPDLQYLAVAALDCHVGIWNVQSLQGEQKDFWYKHLSTVRITDVAFSPDSRSIAVACWDGVCYIYTKAQQSTERSKASSQWIQCNYIVQSSGDRICGLLTGSLVCWPPDSKSVRFSFANEEGSWLNTLDMKTGKRWTAKIAEKGVQVKGMESFRCQEGDFSICYLTSQQLLLSRCAIQDKKVMSINNIDSPKEVLVYEDLMSGVWLVQDDPQNISGMTLRWCRYDDAECQQVKNLCEMLSVKCNIDDNDEKSTSDVSSGGLPAENSLRDSNKIREKEKNTEQKGSFSALSSSSSSSSSRHTSSASSSSSLSSSAALSSPLSSSSTVASSTSPSLSSSSSSSPSSTYIISAPFYDHSTLLSNHLVSNPRHFVLASRMCVVLAMLPSVAYVYHHKSKQWKSIVFGDAVTTCCLVRENILVTLSADEVLRAWHMTSGSTFTCLDSLHIQGLQTKRAFVVGDVYQPLVLVFDVDAQGEGRVAHVTLQDDNLVLTKKRPLCIPTSLASCSSMFGVCVFFTKETSSCSVLVPELNKIYDITYDEQHSSLYQCVMEKKQDLLDFFISKQQS